MKRAIIAVTLVCAIAYAEPARARHQAELESTYVGDGGHPLNLEHAVQVSPERRTGWLGCTAGESRLPICNDA